MTKRDEKIIGLGIWTFVGGLMFLMDFRLGMAWLVGNFFLTLTQII